MPTVRQVLIFLVAFVLGLGVLLGSFVFFAIVGRDAMIVVGVVLFVALYLLLRLRHVAEARQREAMRDREE